LVLSKKTRGYLIFFDLLILAYIVYSFARDYYPATQPVFWIAAAVEIGLAFLTYRFWMRSILGKEYRLYRIRAFLLIIIGIFLPIFLWITSVSFLRPAASADVFYLAAALTLFIYSSFIIERYLDEHGIKSK
jgi:hypothetical protein